MFRKLLVPLDRSVLAEQAVAPAVAIARASDAEIELVLVHESFAFAGFTDAPWQRDGRDDDRQYLASLAAELRSGASIRATDAIIAGEPADAICQRATEAGADLIVMTSHGRTGISRAWLGSVADALVRRCSLPVLILRPVDTGVRRVSARQAFRHVLIPFDGSPLANGIIPAGMMLAKASGAGVTVLRVVPHVPLPVPIEATSPIGFAPVVTDEAATRRLHRDATAETEAFVAQLRTDTGLSIDARVIVNDHTAQAIVDTARGQGADVIAMSTHGRGASRLLLGSIADKVLRASGLPILLRRPSDPDREAAATARERGSEEQAAALR